eukprot:scaffold260986_cov27-Tisochrysis_lutea.AAC.2
MSIACAEMGTPRHLAAAPKTRAGSSPPGARKASKAAAQYQPKSPRQPSGSRAASARMFEVQNSWGALKLRQHVARRTPPSPESAPSMSPVRGWCGHIWPSISSTPERLQPSTRARASAADAASGFSQRTCSPLPAARQPHSACSAHGSAISPYEPKANSIPRSSAQRRARSCERLATATIAQVDVCSAAQQILSAMLAVPSTPTRSRREGAAEAIRPTVPSRRERRGWALTVAAPTQPEI